MSFKMFCCDCPADPIDLTKDGSDQDMQTALMLSMQDMQSSAGAGVLSLEEQELSRYVGRGVIRWSPLPGGVGTWGGVLWGGLSLEEQELSRCVGRGVMG